MQSLAQRSLAVLSCGLMSSGTLALIAAVPVQAQSRFTDTQGIWAQACIDHLASRNIISGYPDGTFRPFAEVTRAEYAAMLGKAFPNAPVVRAPSTFNDVPSTFWAASAIQNATRTGFLSGYPGNVFQPNQNIPRVQAIVALASGLQYPTPPSGEGVLAQFNDAAEIPAYGRAGVAAATAKQVVVNYPNVQFFRPNQLATRADIAAFLCQATRAPSAQALVPTQYIAGVATTSPIALPAGQQIPARFPDAERIVLSPNESVAIRLVTAADVRDSQGRVVIPVGSEIFGQIQPAQGGSQFVANTVVINNRQLPIAANSQVIRTIRDARDPNIGNVFRNAAIGSAVAAGISGLAGDRRITPLKVLTGTLTGAAIETNQGRPATSIIRDTLIGAALATGASAVIGDRKITPEKVITGAAAGATIGGAIDPAVQRLVVIDANTDLGLTLTQPFTVSP
ncbi:MULTISPECIES: S-layer homology domain-containing protein [unclassified Thermosynechococcus]|uniref:S-layer homology domain-containing protein n=1 Tax=unclassified Thermosynechococcus TaxID=2622553 RepID=UPI0019DF7A2B|nr:MULTISPECIES: S-layer homology domain-containing protein [unclassified Thermosynechococcus]HIK36286.1 S-layer homology domain-containing protein [Thermosynechococcus sp. M98_K2018_005]HIK47297.1 S-layer homology domain-containing protein [Thermosynechococcus sp. M55_K2018_012]